eukprot:scaffold31783_cov160-Skeletonema_menzelii.AAC.5
MIAALHRSQLQKDALLLAKAKQAVRPGRAKDKDFVRNTSGLTQARLTLSLLLLTRMRPRPARNQAHLTREMKKRAYSTE